MTADVYGEVVWRALFPAWERGLRRRPTLSLLRDLEAGQRRPREVIEGDQLAALGRLLAHASANVPHYRAQMRRAGIAPDDVASLDDLGRLPILSRAEAQAAGDALLSTAPPFSSIRKTTGGTTGEPLVVRYDAGSEHWRQAVKLRAFGWAGYRVGRRAIHYWGRPTRPDFRLRSRAKQAADRAIKREHYIDCTDRSEAALNRATALIRRIQPRFLFCYAQAGADLARHIHRDRARAWDDIAVICGAEALFDADREAIAGAFGPHVFQTYGCREVMLIASECEVHAGLHVAMENVIVELIVRGPDGVRPARPGEIGEVVLTDLHNYGMPLIRYANGDLASWLADDSPCPCGRGHRRLAHVDGRVTDALRDGHGNRVGGMVFNLIFSPLADHVRRFQATQHADGSIQVKIVPRGRLSPEVSTHVRELCARYLPGIRVTLEPVDTIALSPSGKHRVTAQVSS